MRPRLSDPVAPILYPMKRELSNVLQILLGRDILKENVPASAGGHLTVKFPERGISNEFCL